MQVRVTKEERRRYRICAMREGMTVSAWIRRELMKRINDGAFMDLDFESEGKRMGRLAVGLAELASSLRLPSQGVNKGDGK